MLFGGGTIITPFERRAKLPLPCNTNTSFFARNGLTPSIHSVQARGGEREVATLISSGRKLRFSSIFARTSAVASLVLKMDEEGEQFYFSPILPSNRRQDGEG